mmetsp:Transcript_48029/g.76467  ORF Transcript_48029/g.76467 Transcript_48029/m.76467 type:complete len:320 (-) Transcript_48029:12-971(-)
MANLTRPTVSRPNTAMGSFELKPNRFKSGRDSASQKSLPPQKRIPGSTPPTRPGSSTPRSASWTSIGRPSTSFHSPARRVQGSLGPLTPTSVAARQLQAEWVCPRSSNARSRGPAVSVPLHTVPRSCALTKRSPCSSLISISTASVSPKPRGNVGPLGQARQMLRCRSRSRSKRCRKSTPRRPEMPALCGPSTTESSGTVCTSSSPTASLANCRPLALEPSLQSSCASPSRKALLLKDVSNKNHRSPWESLQSGRAKRSPSVKPAPDGMRSAFGVTRFRATTMGASSTWLIRRLRPPLECGKTPLSALSSSKSCLSGLA